MCVQQLINAGELAPYIGLRPRLTRLLELLAKYAGEKTQQLCCSQETLAAHLSCSVRTISRDLHTLSSYVISPTGRKPTPRNYAPSQTECALPRAPLRLSSPTTR